MGLTEQSRRNMWRAAGAVCRVTYALGLARRGSIGTRILMFHQVEPARFETQMAYLKDHYRVARLQDAIEDLSRDQVVITFDDGYRSILHFAYPVLKALGLPATVFVTCDFARENPFAWWDRMLVSKKATGRKMQRSRPDAIEEQVARETNLDPRDEKPREFDFLSWQELRAISDVFEIGSHTLTHRNLIHLTPQEVETEVIASKQQIKAQTGNEVSAFAYPFGDCSDAIVPVVKAAGYRLAVIAGPGRNACRADRFRMPRRNIDRRDDLYIFANKVAGLL